MRWTILALGLMVATAAAEARIYKWVMPDGSIKYSDRPQEKDAEEVKLPPLTTYTPPPLPQSSSSFSSQDQEPPSIYDRFRIASPANDTAIRDNAGNVTLNFEVSPTLVQGHSIDVYMDGKKFGRSDAQLVRLSNVSRGTHQVYGAIVDQDDNEIIRTETVTIHLQRAAVGGGAGAGGGGASSGATAGAASSGGAGSSP